MQPSMNVDTPLKNRNIYYKLYSKNTMNKSLWLIYYFLKYKKCKMFNKSSIYISYDYNII